MNYHMLTGEITGYLHLSSAELAKWLGKVLNAVYGNEWWKTGVFGKLSYNQQKNAAAHNAQTLSDLDLSALLRIADRNWYAICSRYFLNQSDRMVLQRMFGVWNNWAHAPAVTPEQGVIISDLQALEDFFRFLGVEREILLGFGCFITDVKSNAIDDAVFAATNEKSNNNMNALPDSGDITVNSVVHLASDHSTVGVVVGVDRVDDTLRYKVFVDGKMRHFFERQIEPTITGDNLDYNQVSEIQKMLTAYQIRKPSADSLYSLNAARIDFVPYQFRPALKLLKSEMPRLLIADSVGVGKTIEAGLILKEMEARTSLDTIIIICPKPLVAERKWELEMRNKFDEDFTAVDGGLLRHIMQEVDRDGEWPDKYKRLIIPYSLLTEDLLFGDKNKRRGVPGLNNLDPVPFFDMVIVDEAHHVRNCNTQAHKAVKFFCDNANAAVFLTATPLQLGNQDLFSLLNLLFPETVIDKPTFKAMAEPNGCINMALHHLRVPDHEREALDSLKAAVETDWGRSVVASNPIYKQAVKTLSYGELSREQRVKLINDVESLHSFACMITRTRRQDIEDFCVRRAYTLQSQFTSRQKELHDELLNFISQIFGVLHPTISLKFLMCTIRRQAASCIFGLAPFIKDIVERGLNSLIDDYDIQDGIENASLDLVKFEESANNVIALAHDLPIEDSKFEGLAEIIFERQNRSNNKMIIFSTFRHTLKYLYKKISALNTIRVSYVDGSVRDEDRYALRERFSLPQNDPRALDILLFTEVGSEGLDYQFCDTLVNYDLPWNPMRVEQRIGRIDRRGQKSDVTHIYNCISQGTIDEEIHERCLLRIGIFEHSIGDCSEILGDLAKSIQDIIFDINLTAEERGIKLEQMADNEIRQVQEMSRLEDDEKQIFGMDISSFTDDVDKADNPWLSPEALRRLISGYLEDRLGTDKSRLTDNKMKLTIADKAILADDYKSFGITTNTDNSWIRYLRSKALVCSIAFSHETAKHEKNLFLTPVHPLVRQAAAFYASDKQFTTVVEASCSDIAPGTYPFQFYIWDYTGGKPRTRLIPICTDKEVEYELSTIMQNAISSDMQIDNPETEWDKLSKQHLLRWQIEREKYQNDVDLLCLFRIESLSKSVNARKNSAMQQITETKNDKIIQMRSAEIGRIDGEFAAKKIKLEEIAHQADIHTTLLVNGVLKVQEGN